MSDLNKFNRGRPFDNRDINPNHRPPRYNDDSDYKTNAPSYYEDLARKQGLMRTLAHRIWEYDEVIAKRMAEWDENLEEFDDEVLRLLQEWMEDGTLDHIINDTIFSWKADKEYVDDNFETINGRIDDNKKYVDDNVETINNRIDKKVEKNEIYVLPEYFDALGDGTTIDTLALQNAINHAIDINRPLMINDNHLIDDTLFINGNLKIVGSGQIITTDDFTSHTMEIQSGDVKINGMTFNENNYTTGATIKVWGGTLNAENNTFIGEKYTAISLADKTGKSFIKNNNFKDFYYMVSLEGSIDVIVDGNLFTGGVNNSETSGGNGVKLANDMSKPWLDSQYEASTRTVITNNIFYQCMSDGIDLYTGGHEVIMTGNIFEDCGIMALEVKTIYRDLVEDGGTSIYYYRQARNIVFTNNIIRNFKGTNETVRVSNVDQTSGGTIEADRGVKGVIISNNMFDRVVYAISLTGCRDVNISNNVFKQVSRRIVTSTGYAENVKISSNLLRMDIGDGTASIAFDSPGNRYISVVNNDIYGSSRPNMINYGVVLRGDNMLFKDNFVKNFENGVLFKQSRRVRCQSNDYETIENNSINFGESCSSIILTENMFIDVLTGINYGGGGFATDIMEKNNVFDGVENQTTNDHNTTRLISESRVVFGEPVEEV